MKIVVKVPRTRRRATELFSADSPFRQKVVTSKKVFSRKQKHRGEDY